LYLAIAILAVLAGVFYFTQRTGGGESAAVERGTIVEAVYATGTVEPVYWAKLSAQRNRRVVEILKDENAEVSKGDVVALLDDSIERQQIKQFEAQLEYLESDLKRQKTLAASNYASRDRYEKIQSDVQAVSAQLQAAQETSEQLKIISPLDGIVLRRDIELGEMAREGQTIFWVGKSRPLRITADVDEEDIASVKVGVEVFIKADAFPGRMLKGTLSEITPLGDAIAKVFRARIALPDDTPLLTGMTTEINILIGQHENALLIPSGAVRDNKVMKREGLRYVETPVKTGIHSEEKVEIIEGLVEGDEVQYPLQP